MTKDAAQNTIGRLKDILNEKSNIVQRYKRKIIEAQKYMGQEK